MTCELQQGHDANGNNANADKQALQQLGSQERGTKYECKTTEIEGKSGFLGFSPDGWVALFTGVLTLVSFVQIRFLIRADETARISALAAKQTAESAASQGDDMKASIAEASRAATAMEGVATSMRSNSEQIVAIVATNKEIAARQKQFGEMQIRAYISVMIGTAGYQERDKDFKFEASPVIINTGHTQAFKLKWRIAADILPVPIPKYHRFPLPPGSGGSSVLGPQRDGSMVAVVPDYIDERLVLRTKRGIGQALYVWGTLQYEDIFGHLHRCTFAQQLYWLPSGTKNENGDIPEAIRGWHLSKHNRSN